MGGGHTSGVRGARSGRGARGVRRTLGAVGVAGGLLVGSLAGTVAGTVVAPTRPARAIVGGQSALGNGAVVKLVVTRTGASGSTCSGALWTPRIVVTAAHCVVDAAGALATGVRVYRPGVDIRSATDWVSQSAILVVDGWRNDSSTVSRDDIAFVVLPAPLAGGTISRLATLEELTAFVREGRTVTMLGYGRTSTASWAAASDTPLSLTGPLGLRTWRQWPGEFSVGQTALAGTCPGDSGGPAITQVGAETVLIGVLAGSSGPCFASLTPSTTHFAPAAFPSLVQRALEVAGVDARPVATTGAATAVGLTSAQLGGTVTANNLATTTSITLGTTADLSGTTVSVAGPGVSGTAATAVEVTVANLSPATTYYWRLSATNAAGAASGAIASFRTLGAAPAVTTGPSDTVASTTARVSGEVHPQQITTEAFVQWATVPDFVTLAGTVVIGQIGGGAPVPVTATLPDLVPGTTYYWRVAATNSAGTTAGATGSFVTPTFDKGRALTRDRLATQLAIDPLTTTVTAIEPLARSRRVCTLAGGAAAPRLRLTGLGACDLRVRLLRAGVESVEVLRLAVR